MAMRKSPLIVLLTDFGESEYVGIMKGVIISLSPTSRIVDLTHSIRPQSVREGAWVLLNAFTEFPRNTIFVCVIDPGVGTERDSVYVRTENYSFIGPDNGLMYPAVIHDGIKSISTLVVENDASKTFHGRDVFARAAGYMGRGQAGQVLGGFKPELSVKLEFPLRERDGIVVRIDRFGNIITNIPHANSKEYRIETSDLKWDLNWYPTYSEGPDEGLFLVTGSYDTLEIAVKNASAVEELRLSVGQNIRIE
ncbi:hypothetical protein EU537_06005 [Candidatus Thorarchaeota archaeon]|nr:MAG: hypothetical protein EU537_06005 [Candidatus Thorarchaeota archaeon]